MKRTVANSGRYARAAVVLAAMLSAWPGGTASGQDTGISQEEHLAVFPAAPVLVRAVAIDGGVMIFWEPPPAPPAGRTLAYDPAIERFRVYSIGPGRDRTLIGETAGTWFIDETAPAGSTRLYAVTAVQRSGQESGPSHDVRVRAP